MKVYQVIAKCETHGSYEEYDHWTTPFYIFDSVEKAKEWIQKHLRQEEDKLKKEQNDGAPVPDPIGFILYDDSKWSHNNRTSWSDLMVGRLYCGDDTGSINGDPHAFDETYYIREYELI